MLAVSPFTLYYLGSFLSSISFYPLLSSLSFIIVIRVEILTYKLFVLCILLKNIDKYCMAHNMLYLLYIQIDDGFIISLNKN